MQGKQPTGPEEAREQLLSLCPRGTMIYSVPIIVEQRNLTAHFYVLARGRLVCIDGALEHLLRLGRDDRCEWGLMLPLPKFHEFDPGFASRAVSHLSQALYGEARAFDHLDLVHPGRKNWWNWPRMYPARLPENFDRWREVVDVAFSPLHGRALFGERGVEGRLVSVDEADDRLGDYFPDDPPDFAWRVGIQVVFPQEFTLDVIVTRRRGRADREAELLEEGGALTLSGRRVLPAYNALEAELLEEGGILNSIYHVSDGNISGWVRGERP